MKFKERIKKYKELINRADNYVIAIDGTENIIGYLTSEGVRISNNFNQSGSYIYDEIRDVLLSALNDRLMDLQSNLTITRTQITTMEEEE
jgi:hypothetical protein